MNKRHRPKSGSATVLMILALVLIFVPLLIVLSQGGLYSVDRGRIQNTAEAAGLVAANDLSRIVINDPTFGFVSLSNYPAVGEGTIAADGEPLPVIGINTLVGTIRQNTIVAHELGNETMISLADFDRSRLDATIATLNSKLARALTPGNTEALADIHGKNVELVKDVTSFLRASLPPNVKLESVKLANGWTASGARTDIPIPQPDGLAQIKPQQNQQGKYCAFIDVPACGESFTFAGLGLTSTLVNADGFHQADDHHICSLVRIECIVDFPNRGLLPMGNESFAKLRSVACCQPFSLPDAAPAGLMVIRDSGAPVSGLLYWSDFLMDANFHDRLVCAYSANNGDYPLDHDARLQRIWPDVPSTAQQFAAHLYYWLRGAHLRVRIDSVLALMNEQFPSRPNSIVVYDFAKDGSITRDTIAKDPFPVGVTCDSQISDVCDTSIEGGPAPIIIFRDNVRRLGTIHGGKHGGQPLSGDPPDWCDSPQFGAQLLASSAHSAGIRKSCYSGGLAVDIEIGGTAPSTAAIDVTRMRKLKR